MRRTIWLFSLLAMPAWAQDEPAESDAAEAAEAVSQAADAASEEEPVAQETVAQAAELGDRTLSGMSVLGNEEAPKALVIVPWKSSRLGDGVGVGGALDESARAVDKEVFMRELHYYELRAGGPTE